MRLLAPLVVIFIWSAGAAGATPCTEAESCKSTLTVTGGLKVPYFRTHPLRQKHEGVTRAVIVIHGNARNPDKYFGYVVSAGQKANALGRTAIVAPFFQGKKKGNQKCKSDSPQQNEAYWTCDSWKSGEAAENNSSLSSYAVIDELVKRLADRSLFPRLKHITITGHSAGGQVTARYATANRADGQHAGISMAYVIANPSSYMYLDARRPTKAYRDQIKAQADPKTWTQPGFGAFDGTEECPKFDRYRHGLLERTSYMAKVPDGTLRSQLSGRQVTYLLGLDDHEQDSVLDKSCQARAQGWHRLGRGHAYYHYMRSIWNARNHDIKYARCKHDGGCMYKSDAGRRAVIGE